jgi:nucleotide-binding universal stress UspA family protein
MAAVQPVSLPSITGFQLKHILAATDFSECSHHAIQQAAAIARLHGSELRVVHVIPPPPMI